MPTQKDMVALNDAVMLSLAEREARKETGAQRFDAICRMEDRAERRLVRKMHRAEMLRALDMALVGACVVALAVLVWVGVS